MNVSAYLARIGVSETPAPTARALRMLQFAHLSHIPYENLDILDGVPISLDEDALYEKLVLRGRGGYCFELNELFGRLLRALGYDVTDLFARFLTDGDPAPMRRHHVLKVRVPGEDTPYLCDAGVGCPSPNEALPLLERAPVWQDDRFWRLDKRAFFGWVVEWRDADAWRPLFSFTEEPQLPVDYLTTSFYCEKSPDSPFNKAPMVALRTRDGRKTLDGDEFRLHERGRVTVERLTDPQARDEKLLAWFGLRRDIRA